MKKNIIFRIMVVIACLMMQGKAFAQPPATILPTMADTAIYPSGEPFNTAMISYCSSAQCPASQVVWGIAWLGGPIYVKDEGTGLSATCPIVGSGTPPDVVIGNDLANPGNLIMAVAYYDYLGNVKVDFYEITGVGGALGVAYTGFSSSMPVPGAFQFNTVHIDLIAEHAILPALPVCNKFILTSDDLLTGNIYATSGDLTTHTVNPTPAAFYGFATGSQPDVAAIQRQMIGGSIHDIGLVPYVDGANLMYTELDFTTGAVTLGPILLDAITGSTFVVPRIDAIDDYVTNAPLSIAQYKIAVAVNTGSASDIRTYDNFFPMFKSAFLLTVPGYTSLLNNYSPVVAVSGPQDYSVYHWTQEVTGTLPTGQYLTVLDPIDRTASATLSPNNYFWVNSLGGVTVNTAFSWVPGTWLISASSCVNYNANANAPNLYAWAETTLSGYITKYKISNSATFAFREGSIPGSVTTVPHNWALYPNPATQQLNITNATGNSAATMYHIVDVKGSDVLHGDITGSSTAININELVPGNYFVKLINDKDMCGDMKFVKE